MRLLALLFGMVLVSGSAFADCTSPNAEEGVIIYSSDYGVLQGCAVLDWVVLHQPRRPCGASPTIGQTCIDDTIYVGLSPDGNVPMYTTPADAPGGYSWNDGSTNWTDTAIVNCTDVSPGTASSCQTGKANTALLVALNGSGTPAPYDAAEYCDDLTAHGHSDWYLPAQDELNEMFNNKNTGDLNGTFNETGSFPEGRYYSSSELSVDRAKNQNFNTGNQAIHQKYHNFSIRCVRK